MKLIRKLKVACLLLLTPLYLNAQEKTDSVLRFSLVEAQIYALENSPLIKNANLDLESAKKKIWETTAIGLPQVNAKLSGSYMLTVPAALEQFSSFSSLGTNFQRTFNMLTELNKTNPDPNYVPNTIDSIGREMQAAQNDKSASDDMRWGLTANITVSQLIFSGSYIVGLQTAKVYRGLSEIAVTKSKNEVHESLTNSYYLVLIARENKIITDSTLANMKKLLDEAQQMYKQGLLEETDVDQLSITVSNVQLAADMLTRQIEISLNLLKYQMGLPIEKQIVLTDDLNVLLNNSSFEVALLNGFNVENNSDYKLMDTQAKLMNLNLKLQKSAFLPDIAAFYQHEKNFNTKSFTFTPPDMVGFSISLPLFTSGSRLAKVSQAKLGYLKAVNTRDQIADGLKIEFANAKSNFLTSKDKYDTDKRNLELAKKIYERSSIKYRQGIMGSMDITQVQNQYLQTQSSYFNSLLSLVNAKNKLNRLLTIDTYK